MSGVVVLSDLEAGIDGAPVSLKLDELAPRSLGIELGDSALGRAILALVALEAVWERFPLASVSIRGRRSVECLLGAHFAAIGARVEVWDRPDLILDFRPAIRRRARFVEGVPPVLEIPAAPYPARKQHAAQHWIDGARASGFQPKATRPRLTLPRASLERGRALWARSASKSPVVILAARPHGYPRERLAHAGNEVAQRIGGNVFSVGAQLAEIPAIPTRNSVVCAAALQFASIVIGDAGGWCDVAAAMGAPTLGILGRACPTRHGPVCDLGTALSARCRTPREHGASEARDLRCLACLTPQSVVENAEELAARRWPWDWAARLGLWNGGA